MSHTTQTRPSYEDAIASLSTLIPELLGVPGMPRRKFSLDEIRILSAALGNPHRKFPSILVAGTNGKGSTSATLASIARSSGLRVGLYTSPHLARVNERIRLLTPSNATDAGATDAGAPGLAFETGDRVSPQITGQRKGTGFSPYIKANRADGASAPEASDIPDQTFADLYFRVLEAARHLVATSQLATLPSYFEHLTALAFLYFAEEQVDLAVLEVGMGGRLDATNLVDPILSVITDISLDHQEWLGSTIALIAREKAGILRENGTLVTLPQHPEANQAIGEAAVALSVRGISAADYTPASLPLSNPGEPYKIEVLGTEILADSPLKGAHQHRNIALAVAAAVELAENHNFPITPASVQQGIQTTSWPGRLESVIPDPESFAALAGSPDALKGRGFSRATESQQSGGALAPEGNPLAEFIPEFILDVAHNPAGAWALRAALNSTNPGAPHLASGMRGANETNPGAPGLASETGDPRQVLVDGVAENGEANHHKSPGAPGLASETGEGQCLIFACLRDKPLREMAQILFPIFDHVILAPIHSPRATDLADLLAAAESTGTPSTPASTVAEAIQLALALRPARIVVSGSVYLVGEARTLLLEANPAPKAPTA